MEESMLRFFPICGRAHTGRQIGGLFRCETIFANAINLTDASGVLLTLHRFGHGLSPMGLVLNSNDFDWISARVSSGMYLATDDSGRWAGTEDWCFSLAPERIWNLELRETFVPDEARLHLARWLGSCRLKSGFGVEVPVALEKPSEEARTLPLLKLSASLMKGKDGEISRIWKQVMPRLLGAGQGLTPAGDDMLIGLLSGAYLRRLCGIHTLVTELDASLCGNRTTLVSRAYLHHAALGRFSTPFLRVLRAMTSEYKVWRLDSRLGEFSKHGHTSGLDTLIGLLLMLGSGHGFSKTSAS